jgi:hypothetical protein
MSVKSISRRPMSPGLDNTALDGKEGEEPSMNASKVDVVDRAILCHL